MSDKLITNDAPASDPAPRIRRRDLVFPVALVAAVVAAMIAHHRWIRPPVSPELLGSRAGRLEADGGFWAGEPAALADPAGAPMYVPASQAAAGEYAEGAGDEQDDVPGGPAASTPAASAGDLMRVRPAGQAAQDDPAGIAPPAGGERLDCRQFELQGWVHHHARYLVPQPAAEAIAHYRAALTAAGFADASERKSGDGRIVIFARGTESVTLIVAPVRRDDKLDIRVTAVRPAGGR